MINSKGKVGKERVVGFYDALAPVYSRWREFGHKRNQHTKDVLISALKPFEDDIILDVGTGPGIYAVEVAKQAPSCRVHAIDVSQAFIEIAAERGRSHGVTNIDFEIGNIEQLHFDDHVFTKIICAGVISVVSNKRQAVGELARVLKPGGRIAIREPKRSESRPSRFLSSLPDKSLVRRASSHVGLMFGHFSPDYMTEHEIAELFLDNGFSKVDLAHHGPDMLIQAIK